MSTSRVKKQKHIDIKILQEHFEIKGKELVWKKHFRSNMIGKRAGNVNSLGYVDIGFQKMRFYAHRIAYAIHHGHWPLGIIDHIDRDSQNNSPDNLRDVTDSENSFNHGMKSTNKSGIKGVSAHSGGWSAEIKAYKKRYRKWFKNKSQAEEWIKEKRLELHVINSYNNSEAK